MTKIDKNYTFKPVLCEKSNIYVNKKNPTRKSQNVNEKLYKEGLDLYK